jgi:hypothetical protein
MSENDVKQVEESSASEEEKDESKKQAAADSDKSETEESRSIPYARFKEINEAKKQAEKVANWYRDNVGNPDDVIAFRKWQEQQVKTAEKKEAKGDLSPEQLAEIRKVMRMADTDYARLIEEQERTRQERIEAQFDEAAEYVREIAEDKLGLKGEDDEKHVNFLAKEIMIAIQDDEKLLRLWRVGKTERAVSGGFKTVREIHDGFGKSLAKLKQEAAEKRRVSKLPTLPRASASLSSRRNDPNRQKGITKQTHEDAYALIQQLSQE